MRTNQKHIKYNCYFNIKLKNQLTLYNNFHKFYDNWNGKSKNVLPSFMNINHS